MPVLLCQCTCPDHETARTIARILVEERLAACASLQPGVGSVYRWQGQVEEAEEILLVAKTTQARLPELTARIQALHPYDVPEILATEVVGGSHPYLDWVDAETRPDGTA